MSDAATDLTIEDIQRRTCEVIRKSPEILSLLYDLDLLPEQLEVKSKDWQRMVIIVELVRHSAREITAANAKLSRIFHWIERNHPDGFIDGESYESQLDKISDRHHAQIDEANRSVESSGSTAPLLGSQPQ